MPGQKFNYKVVLLAMTHWLAIAAAEMIKWGVKTWGEGRRLCFPRYRMLDKCEPGDTYGKRRVAIFSCRDAVWNGGWCVPWILTRSLFS